MISSSIVIALMLASAAQANPLNFPGRNKAEPNRRVPNPCMTMDNTVCVFPFKYNDVEYYQCTYASSPTPWCATKVDANGTVITNNWGDCANTQTSACPVEDLTKPSCTAISGESCIFPFRYQVRKLIEYSLVVKILISFQINLRILYFHKVNNQGQPGRECCYWLTV